MADFIVEDPVASEAVSLDWLLRILFIVKDVKLFVTDAISMVARGCMYDRRSLLVRHFAWAQLDTVVSSLFNSWHSSNVMAFTSLLFGGWSCHKCRLKS